MSENYEVATQTGTNLVKIQIDDDIINSALAILGGSADYVKITDRGLKFSSNETAIPSVDCVIGKIELFQEKWVGKVVEKAPYVSGPTLPDFKLRGTLPIYMSPTHQETLSLPPTSLAAALSYIKSLRNQGIDQYSILTRVSTKLVSGIQTYAIAVFSNLGAIPVAPAAPMRNVTPPTFTPPTAPIAPPTGSIPSAWL